MPQPDTITCPNCFDIMALGFMLMPGIWGMGHVLLTTNVKPSQDVPSQGQQGELRGDQSRPPQTCQISARLGTAAAVCWWGHGWSCQGHSACTMMLGHENTFHRAVNLVGMLPSLSLPCHTCNRMSSFCTPGQCKCLHAFNGFKWTGP